MIARIPGDGADVRGHGLGRDHRADNPTMRSWRNGAMVSSAV